MKTQKGNKSPYNKQDSLEGFRPKTPMSEKDYEIHHARADEYYGRQTKQSQAEENGTDLIISNPWSGKRMKNNEFDIYLAVHGRAAPFIGPLTLEETVRREKILAGEDPEILGNEALDKAFINNRETYGIPEATTSIKELAKL